MRGLAVVGVHDDPGKERKRKKKKKSKTKDR